MKENLQIKFDNFQGPYDFSGTEWQGLEERLNKRDLVPLGLLSLLAGFLLLGLLVSSILLWRQNTTLNKRLSVMETAKTTTEKGITSATEKAATTTVLGETDTIRKRKIIYQYDTIYRKITVVETPYLTTQYQQSPTPETTISTKETTDKAAQARPNTSTTAATNLITSSTTVPTINLDSNPVTRPSGREKQQQNGNNTSKLPDETAGQTPQYPSKKMDKNGNITSKLPNEKAGQYPQYPNGKMDKNADNVAEIKEKQTLLTTTGSLSEKETIAKKPAEAVVDSTALASTVDMKKPFTKDSIVMKKFPFDSLDIVKKDDKNDKKGDDKTGKKHPKYVFKMLPIYVGGTLGLPIWSDPSTVGETANQYGLKAEIVATERVRFFADVNYSKNAESKSTSLATVPNEITPPRTEPGFAFRYWEVYNLKSVRYIGGIQYRFGSSEKFRPYVAAGFNGTTILPFEIDFEYRNAAIGMDKGIKQKMTNRLTHLNRFYGGIGVHWNAFTNGQLSAETYLTSPFTNDKALTPTQIGLKIGAFYFIR
jgi:hypothetical protein